MSLKAFSQSDSTDWRKIYLSELDLSKMTSVMGTPRVDRSIRGDTMRIGGKQFLKGVGTHAYSRMLIDLHGSARRFTALVGLDDAGYVHASISFHVVGDQRVLWQSGPMKKGDAAKEIDLDIRGVQKLGLLVTVNREDISENYANWALAQIIYTGQAPMALDNKLRAREWGILTPPAPRTPRIHAPSVYGVGPGSPVLYRIPCTGDRPILFSAKGLPGGLSLNKATGIITGTLKKAGQYKIELSARNKYGQFSQSFTIVAGDKLALTPPMGWNSWYIYYHQVSDSFMRKSADAMLRSGMADYGYQYVNIDDCWMNKPGSSNPEESGPVRSEQGELLTNKRFPDMNALTDYIHAKGLKAGIYSSPGPKTCAGYAGSYEHEVQDANTFARWGFDFLKYDWCSYGAIPGSHSMEGMKAPYLLMGEALKKTGRDMLHNLCQYGMGDVWTWGAEAGHSWRVGPDLGTATGSFIPGFYNTGLLNSEHWSFAGPGGWNDPDYITIGWVGGNNGKGRQTALTHNEQYAYMTMWSLMASPLFFSGDMNRLDSFTLNVLCNHEVIAINQDAAGRQARIIRNDSTGMVMVKELADGSLAVGLFNYPGNKQNPADYFVWDDTSDGQKTISIRSSELRIPAGFTVRNAWTQEELGQYQDSFNINVPYHGAVLLKITNP